MKQVKHLASGFKPEVYEIFINLDVSLMSFSGTVIIKGQKIGRPSNRLTFHQKDLRITGATVTKHDKKGLVAIDIDHINVQRSFDELRLHTKNVLYAGNYEIKINFMGKITKQMHGLYPCNFKDGGTDKFILATQFESHHAREVFPCIDEPAAKAVFNLTLETNQGDTVLSNTPLKTSNVKDNRQTTAFEPTPLMSSYLLAFVCGEISKKSAKTKRGTLVSVYTTAANLPHTTFALKTAVDCLEFYEDYFDIPYPLAKCDMVALPDFAAGAMENWGLITYREQSLLDDPANTTLSTRQYVAMVVAHELAHQWFGNLVTMRWWTDLWLNEGFASWIEYLAVDHLHPDWQMWTQFLIDETTPALRLDALDNTHPVEVAVNHPDEISTIFDSISYSKGASLINMLHQFMGPELFRNGLRHYLKTYAYKNTDTADLWGALEHVSKLPIKSFMSDWTHSPGYPLISVGINKSKLQISQQRFYFIKPTKHNAHLWQVPLLAYPKLTETELSVEKAMVNYDADLPVIINNGRSGFYRVAYSPQLIGSLATAIEAGKLNPADRTGTLADAFEAAKAGYGNTADALKLLSSYKNEDNSVVWEAIALYLGELRHVMNDETLREKLKPFTRQLVAIQLERLGWQKTKSESHFDSLLRPTILGLASIAEDKSVSKKCRVLFDTMKNIEEIEPDIRGVVLSNVARHGNEADFERMMTIHNSTQSPDVRLTLSAALSSFEQQDFIERSLAMIKSPQVKLQDALYWLMFNFSNRFARTFTWEWLKTNWQWLEQNLGKDISFNRVPIIAARAFSDKTFIKEYKEFFEPKISPNLERAIKQGLETLTWQVAWKTRELVPVKKYFNSNK